jgi:hypothetical protein
VAVNDSDVGEFDGYSATPVGNNIRLVKDGEEYGGDAPYIILGVDGKPEPTLEAFEPHLASAAVLEKFYPSGDRFGTTVDELGKALKLHNDLRFRLKAQDMKARLDRLEAGSLEYQRFSELYEAYRKNIQQPEFEMPALDNQ